MVIKNTKNNYEDPQKNLKDRIENALYNNKKRSSLNK